jgi:hypothetical protein
MIGERTRISLAQYLALQGNESLDLLFRKQGLRAEWETWRDHAGSGSVRAALVNLLSDLAPDRLLAVLEEIASTEADMREWAGGSWGDGLQAYSSRWRDLRKCLALDGYEIGEGHVRAVEPELPGAAGMEDALTAEVHRSGLPSANGILALVEQSANAFLQSPPNYNACLSNARAAVQTLATEIAQARQAKVGGAFQADKWGQVLEYLRTSGLIAKTHEDLVSAVYTFISPGAHTPIALSQEEMVRLGRGMAVSIGYFLVKLHNA